MGEVVAEGVTLDQLQVLVAVVDEGSFTAAARKLHRVQGAVSYNVATLEELLELKLFDRSRRRATLTPTGQAVVAEARRVLAATFRLRATVRGISEGLEPALSVAIDTLFPPVLLAEIVTEFQARFPTVHLEVCIGALGSVLDDLEHGDCTLGVVGFPVSLQGMIEQRTIEVEMVAVVASSHPLAQISGQVSDQQLDETVHIWLSDRSGRDSPLVEQLRPRTWRVNDMETRNALLRAGLGWARVPKHRVERELKHGELVELELMEQVGRARFIPLRTVFRQADPPGPAGRWLLDRFHQLASDTQDKTRARKTKGHS